MKKSASELWAVVDKATGEVMYSRGGSSTTAKLMVYNSQGSAERVLKNPWIKQVINTDKVIIIKIYSR